MREEQSIVAISITEVITVALNPIHVDVSSMLFDSLPTVPLPD
jgi:hypothetical protein